MLITPHFFLKKYTFNMCLFLSLISLFSWSCEDETAPIKERELIVDTPIAGTLPPAGSTAGTMAGTPAGQIIDENATRILLPAGETEKIIAINGETELSVFLFDQNGEPLAQQRIQFQITSGLMGATPTDQEAALSASRTISNEAGLAKVTFQAGSLITHYQVQATAEGARRPVTFEIDVVNLPMGSLNISFDYQGPVTLKNLEVYLLREPDFCETPYYLTPPMDPFINRTVERISDRLSLDSLLAGESFSVLVRARNESGVLVGGGCEGDIRIFENEQRNTTVALFLLPLNPAGRYEVTNHFNFAGAIPGTIGTIVQNLLMFFGDQNHERMVANVIFDAIEELARQAVGAIGGLIVNTLENWLSNDLNRLINQYIDNDGPEWLRDFFTIGSDMISIVSNLEVLSEMNLSKPRGDGTFDGSQNWVGLTFYWRLNCDANDQNCGRYPFRMDELASGAEEIDLVFGQFTGRLYQYNQGVVNLHTMDLQYGRLIMFVLNHMILPAIADGATNLRDALLNLANCPNFANRLTGGRDNLFGVISRNTIQSWCVSAMELVGDGASLLIGQLRLDTRMDLEGTMTMVEENSDLAVDQLIDGVWRGHLRTSSDSGAEFLGDFNGHKLIINPQMSAMSSGE